MSGTRVPSRRAMGLSSNEKRSVHSVQCWNRIPSTRNVAIKSSARCLVKTQWANPKLFSQFERASKQILEWLHLFHGYLWASGRKFKHRVPDFIKGSEHLPYV